MPASVACSTGSRPNSDSAKSAGSSPNPPPERPRPARPRAERSGPWRRWFPAAGGRRGLPGVWRPGRLQCCSTDTALDTATKQVLPQQRGQWLLQVNGAWQGGEECGKQGLAVRQAIGQRQQQGQRPQQSVGPLPLPRAAVRHQFLATVLRFQQIGHLHLAQRVVRRVDHAQCGHRVRRHVRQGLAHGGRVADLRAVGVGSARAHQWRNGA